jgi:hypothetical protein
MPDKNTNMPQIGDAIRFQRRGNTHELTGMVVSIHECGFDVRRLPLDNTDLPIMLVFMLDWWVIVERNGRPVRIQMDATLPNGYSGESKCALPCNDSCVESTVAERPRRAPYESWKGRARR